MFNWTNYKIEMSLMYFRPQVELLDNISQSKNECQTADTLAEVKAKNVRTNLEFDAHCESVDISIFDWNGALGVDYIL